MGPERQQYYLRAEPTAEGHALLRDHQRALARICDDLRLNPRLTRADDLHWTVLFLGSPDAWTRALHALDVRLDVSADDLARWADVSELSATPPAGTPTGFDAFIKGRTGAVFVLNLATTHALTETIIRSVRAGMEAWERAGAIPGGTAARLFRHPRFPLRRELGGGLPHVTLARGRVSRERQRDVRRTLRLASLSSRTPITFSHAELRIVQSPTVVRRFGP